MNFLRKYNTLLVTGTTAIKIPIIKRAVVDFAASGDWTPASGDVKVWVDGTAANITNLPTAINSGNCTHWEFILTAAELSGKNIIVTVTDSATKAVEDQHFIVETFGHASAMYAADLSLANLPANVTQLLGTAWLTPGTAGTPDVNAKLIGATAQTGADVGGIVSSGTHGNSALKTLIDNLDNILDTEFPALVTTIGTPAAASIAADLLTIDNLVDDLEGRLTSTRAGYLDNLSAGAVAQASALSTAQTDLDDIQKRIPDIERENTATAGSFSTITLDAGASSVDDYYIGMKLVITGGTGSGQTSYCRDYVGSTKVLDFHPDFLTAVDNTSTFRLIRTAAAPARVDFFDQLPPTFAGVSGLLQVDVESIDGNVTAASTARVSFAANYLDAAVSSRASQTSVDTIDDLLDTEFGALVSTVGALYTTALTQSYRSAGNAPTMAQFVFETIAHLGDSSISGTVKTLNNLAGTAAKTFNLDSATVPTSITEAT